MLDLLLDVIYRTQQILKPLQILELQGMAQFEQDALKYTFAEATKILSGAVFYPKIDLKREELINTLPMPKKPFIMDSEIFEDSLK